MPINENNPIEIPTIVVKPQPWQLAYSALPQDVKNNIYSIVKNQIKDVATNPYKEEYLAAKKEFDPIGRNYWPANAEKITDRFDKAIDNYYRWNPLNSEEGYQALKKFHDDPGVHLELVTYPYLSRIPISHSEIHGAGPSVNVQMNDKGYNLFTNNCSDATKKLIEHVKGVNMPEGYWMTTPNKVRKWAVNTFPTIPVVKGDSVLMTSRRFEPIKYLHNPEAAKVINERNVTHDIFPLNITELSRWYNYNEDMF